MKSAKEFYQSSGIYQELKQELIKKHDAEKVSFIFEKAGEKLEALRIKYADIPKGDHAHADKFIFPRAAFYLSMKENIGDEAFQILKEVGKEYGLRMGKKLGKFTKTRFIAKLFVKMFGIMGKRMFGNDSGFKQTFYQATLKKSKFDIMECPYKKYFTLCGCEEIAPMSCDSDIHCYGNLPNIIFNRTQTLATGGDKCDFEIIVKPKKAVS